MVKNTVFHEWAGGGIRRLFGSCLVALAATGLFVVAPYADAETLTMYSGRSRAFVEPVLRDFQRDTGIEVQVRYGGTAELANALQEEGDRTRADLFWAQDAGALGAMHEVGRLRPLSETLLEEVSERFRNEAGTWVATSGRARVLAYSPSRVDEGALPESIHALTGREWRGRVGWAPSNGSFQAFVTAMRHLEGEEETERWLRAMRENGVRAYANNSAIVQAIAAGEIDAGLTNHYYLLRFRERDPEFPVAQTFFEPGATGNLLNVAGVGVLRASGKQEAAERLIEYLLSDAAQEYLTREVFEYPVKPAVAGHEDLLPFSGLLEVSPEIDLDRLEDLPGTLRMLRRTGLL